MNVIRTVSGVRAALAGVPARTCVGFVPTMGALHAGHVALLATARAECDHLVASLFVNPAQFDDPVDLEAYPRQESDDTRVASEAGVDTLFVPDRDELFGPDAATTLRVQGAALGFEGACRPGHFDGVALICLKLFAITQPSRAYVGQKDAQQVAVLEQLVRDLNLAVQIRVVPTVRDVHGLALSSRNARLSDAERVRALALPRALHQGLDAYRRGADVREAARSALAGLDVDYVDVARFGAGPTLVVAVRIGTTRLIDNIPLDRPDLAGLAPNPLSGS